jgi:flagellin
MDGVGRAKFAGVATLFDPITRRGPQSDWGRADGMVIADPFMFQFFRALLKGGPVPAIATNNAANAVFDYLNKNNSLEASSIAQLASGSRINQSSDDGAGLDISEQLKATLTNFAQDSVSVQQGTDILSTAGAGLAQISLVLTRMMALASESASGQVTDTQRRQDIDVEYQQLSQEINSIASGTQYNGQSLLNYANATGAFSWNSSSVLSGFYAAQVLRNTHQGSQNSQIPTDEVGDITNGDQIATYTSGIDGLPTGTSGSFNAAPLEGLNGDPFGPTRFLTGMKPGESISVSIGAFNGATLGLEQDSVSYQDSDVTSLEVNGHSVSVGAYLAAHPTEAVPGQVAVQITSTRSNVASQSAAMLAVATLSAAINSVDEERAQLGAYESRFTFSQEVVAVQMEQTSSSISTIRDADVASVKARLSAQDLATRTSLAAMAQASQLPQALLRLIQSQG